MIEPLCPDYILAYIRDYWKANVSYVSLFPDSRPSLRILDICGSMISVIAYLWIPNEIQ